MGATVFSYFSVGFIEHIFECRFFYILPRFIEQVFTQNADETKISLAYNFQKSPFFVV